MAPDRRLPSSNRPTPANSLLAALPADDYARVAPTLRNTPLKLKRILHKPGEAIDRVYFPGGGFASVVTGLKDGGMVEVATIGREGMLGMSALLNGDPAPAATILRAETDVCYTMSVKAFRQEMDRHGAFYGSRDDARVVRALKTRQLGFVMTVRGQEDGPVVYGSRSSHRTL
jgi:CRP-like cAMP-binding protein